MLRLSDGTVIDTRTGSVVGDSDGTASVDERDDFVAIPTHTEAQEAMTRVRKRVADLPDVPQRLNAVSVVAMYHLWGLEPYDIALATDLSEHQVVRIMKLDAFKTMLDDVTTNVLDGQGSEVRTIIAGASGAAAQRMVRLLNDQDAKMQIIAAKDILDRAGHRPNDVIEHRHKLEGGLVIEYKRRTALEDEPPMIDVTPIDEGDDDGSSS